MEEPTLFCKMIMNVTEWPDSTKELVYGADKLENQAHEDILLEGALRIPCA